MSLRNAPKLSRKRQVLFGIEVSTTPGVYFAPTAATGILRVYKAPNVSATAPLFKRDIARASISPMLGISGERTGTITMQAELVGSGSVATAPEVDTYLQACGMRQFVVKAISIGAITTGPIERGNKVTGGTSAAVGRVLQTVATGASKILVEVISGTFAATETLTESGSKGTGSGTCVSSSLAVPAGFGYTPTSSFGTVPTLTIECEEDGYVKTLVGSRGTFGIKAQSGQPAFIDFTFTGAIDTTKWIDRAMTSAIPFFTTVPPVFMGVGFMMNRGLANTFNPILSSFELTMANGVTMRKDANSANGLVGALITDRAPTMKFNPEFMTKADYDIFGDLFTGNPVTVDLSIGSVAGNTVAILTDAAQYDTVGDTDSNGVATADVDLTLHTPTTTGDDEFELLFI